MFGKVPGRVVGTAHDAPRPQLLAYLGMEREEFGGGQLGKVRQLFIHPFNEFLPCRLNAILFPRAASAPNETRFGDVAIAP